MMTLYKTIIANRFSKSLFFRRFPEASNLTFAVNASETGSSSGAEWKSLEKEHTVFSKLIHCIASIVENRRCILSAIRNSTATSLELGVRNTLRHGEGPMLGRWIYYWLSAGRSNPDGSETLTYLLISDFCVINEIIIQPYRADLEQGKHIYSASTVRFRMGDYRLGHETSPAIEGEDCTGNEYVGTYVSPKFPMLQL